MINSNYFDVDIDIPSSDFVRQDLFKAFSCTIDVFPGQVFPLELIEITRKANLNQLYRMRLVSETRAGSGYCGRDERERDDRV